MTMMQAWGYNQKQIELINIKIPTALENTVLIKNEAIGLNPVDWKIIAGKLDDRPRHYIPGVDAAGTIVQLGEHTQHLKIGTRVAYHTDLTKNGSFSEYTMVNARALMTIPDDLDEITAAAFPCPGLTAWQAIEKLPKIDGKKILVNGAGGAVGSLITQLLIQKGAKVCAIASHKRHAKLEKWGAKQLIDYHEPHWYELLLQSLTLNPNERFYAAFDLINGGSAAKLAPLLEYYGHLISIQDRIEIAPLPAFTTSISLHEIALASQHIYGSNQQWRELTYHGNQLLQQIAVGNIVPPNIQTIPFHKIDIALEKLKYRNDGTKYVAIFE